MIYRKIDTTKVKPEMDFEQIQSDLEKFKNHTSMPQDDVKMSPPSKNGHRKATKNGMNRSHSFVFLKTSAFIPRFT